MTRVVIDYREHEGSFTGNLNTAVEAFCNSSPEFEIAIIGLHADPMYGQVELGLCSEAHSGKYVGYYPDSIESCTDEHGVFYANVVEFEKQVDRIQVKGYPCLYGIPEGSELHFISTTGDLNEFIAGEWNSKDLFPTFVDFIVSECERFEPPTNFLHAPVTRMVVQNYSIGLVRHWPIITPE